MAEINKPTVTAAVPSYSLRLRSRDMSVANPDSETSTSSHLMHLAEHRGRRTRNPRVFTPAAPRNPSGFTARYRAHRCPPNWNSQLRALSRPLTQPQHDSKLLPHRDWRLQLRLTGHTRPPAVPVRARTHARSRVSPVAMGLGGPNMGAARGRHASQQRPPAFPRSMLLHTASISLAGLSPCTNA